MNKKTIVLIVMDGLGDRPSPNLGNRTPLEFSYHPNLNRMARNSISGLCYPVSQGLVCGSDTSHMSLLGYDPSRYYTGRGPFEALGLGMDVNPGDIAFRANYGTRRDGKIVDRRAGRIEENTQALSEALSVEIDGVTFKVKSGVEHRAALVMHGENLSDAVSDTDPHHENGDALFSKPLKPEAEETSRILNEFIRRSREILDQHPFNRKRSEEGKLPANEILLRGPGKMPYMEPFSEKYGMSSAFVIAIPMIKGLARLLKMQEIKVNGITGSVNSNFKNKIEAIDRNIGDYDFILCNIKGTDAAAHDRNPEMKAEVLEKIDMAMEPLVSRGNDALIVITGDHSTSSVSGEHTGDPVPIMFFTEGANKIPSESFTEKWISKTGFSIMSGNVMNYSRQLTDRLEKYGA
ncbi:2,3-bisphosphoglycerate-independent phosphoglycerate mutase [Caldiplasma sukawensis]